MSVLIKGMEMPKSCSKCGWFDMGGGDGYRCTLLRKSFDMWNKISVARDKNCPLIEIPTPHGRLIDADELNIHDVSPAYGFCVMGVTEEDIELADTIIEAEGRQHHD